MNIRDILYGVTIAMATLSGLVSCGDSESRQAAADRNTRTVIDNIMSRTSVRKYTGQSVGMDTLRTLVRAGMAAPTAANRQPWAFVVVTDPAMRDSLAKVHPMSHLEKAAAGIVVCGDTYRTMDGASGEFWQQDCSAASENILLAANAYGLGAVWCGVYPIPERVSGVRRVLGLPLSIVPLSIITVGHKANDPKPKDKWNPENIHYNRW